MKHYTTWEDEGLAGIKCGNNAYREADPISSEESDQQCSLCGQGLQLRWQVVLIEKPAAPPKEPEA